MLINTNFSVGDNVYYCVPERIKVMVYDGKYRYVLIKNPMNNKALVDGIVFQMYWDKSVSMKYMLREIIGDSYSTSFPVGEEDVFATMQECDSYCYAHNAARIQEEKDASIQK